MHNRRAGAGCLDRLSDDMIRWDLGIVQDLRSDHFSCHLTSRPPSSPGVTPHSATESSPRAHTLIPPLHGYAPADAIGTPHVVAACTAASSSTSRRSDSATHPSALALSRSCGGRVWGAPTVHVAVGGRRERCVMSSVCDAECTYAGSAVLRVSLPSARLRGPRTRRECVPESRRVQCPQ